MTPSTQSAPAAPQRLQAPPWPSDVEEGAHLILEAVHALLTGPAAVAYLKPSAMGGASLDAKAVLDAAEVIAADCMARSFNRAPRG